MSTSWQVPLQAAPNKIRKEIEQSTILNHYCNLDIHDKPCEEIRTGIMCDIGIHNRDSTTIQRLIAAGMTIARLNMRDLEPEACVQLIQSIRKAVYNYSAELQYVYPLAVIVDVRGPDISTGDLKGGPKATVELLKGNTLRLTTDASWRENGTAECLFVGYDLLTDLQCGDLIFIDSVTPGVIKLIVTSVGDDALDCFIDHGGIISSKMTVRVSKGQQRDSDAKKCVDSNDHLTCNTISEPQFEHMEDQINWAIMSDIDAILVPNVRNSADVRHVRDILTEKGKHILLFACIETTMGMDNLDEILVDADGIFMDRCILSTDLPVEKIFIANKVILAKCGKLGKPCICKAVINEQIPTLCVTDIANLVLDGADVLTLEMHYDSPLIKFAPTHDPVRMAEHCLAAAVVVCKHAEQIIWQQQIYGNLELMQSPTEEPTKALCVSAVELSVRSQASVIICMTNSGRTAKMLSFARPSCPIIAVTRACHTSRQLRFWRGVRAIHYFEAVKGSWAAEIDARIRTAIDYCKAKRILKAGDPFVIVTGSRRGMGYCDSIRLLYASMRDTIVVDMIK